MQNLYLYGSGNRCRLLLQLIKHTPIKVLGVIDSDREKWGQILDGYVIESPDILFHKKSSVCVTFFSSLIDEPVWSDLEGKYEISPTEIYSFHQLLIYIYSCKNYQISIPENNSDPQVLFDGSWELGLGGVEYWLKDVVKGLLLSKCENVCFITKKNQIGMPEIIEKHIKELCFINAPLFSDEYIKQGLSFLMENVPCTIVFSRVDELMLAAYLVKKRYPDKIRIIMAVHGSCDGMYRDILSYKDGIDRYVCVSSGIRKELIAKRVDADKIDVMTCPVEINMTLNHKYTLNNSLPLRLGYAGRLEILHKRIDILLKLISELEKRNINYHFSIAGEGNCFEMVEKFIHDNKLEEKISLLGRIDRGDISKFWQNQDIAINTSESEGRPLSNMEAMVNGAVPVVTRTIGILEDVENGTNGFIVPLMDYTALADKIEFFEKNRTELPVFGEKAREDMLLKSNLDNHIEYWKDVLY